MSLRVLSLWNRVGSVVAARGTMNNSMAVVMQQQQQQQRGFASKKHKAVIKQSKGFRGRAKNCYTIAIRRLQKSWQYAYRDRKVQKREWRKLWIQRVNAGVRQYGISYSQFIPALEKSNVQLNRKVLAALAAQEPFSFKAVVDVVKQQSKL